MRPHAAALEQLRALDGLATHRGPQQDARAHLLVTALFLLAVLSCGRDRVAPLLLLAAYPAWMVIRCGLPFALLGRALLLALPLLLLAVGASPWLDRAPARLPGGAQIAHGWLVLAATLLRGVLSVTTALTLVAATGLRPLCAALTRLGMPELLTAQLLLLHRYAFVMLDEGARMHTAWQLRAGAARRPPLRVWAPMAGQWLLRTLARAGRIHQAMLARGYDGRLHLAHGSRWRAGDSLHVAGWAAAIVAARWLAG
ncbi:Cobalt ECF transporter T component CbiQ [Rubrivivax sp. A210]|uniref:energy-coupling factor transporter transmembrane component T family protein n=1 Tax=Rubrivivax sp. A210 TaxID=2772301 RepID=UPI001917B7DD|nr:energy-coupling factor transporter transmembrane component T [Rubrivivax sp. A210]CAD5375009.1 Cobalt ECF transporter T component CbiQ [Rubrivivax sp. A210]